VLIVSAEWTGSTNAPQSGCHPVSICPEMGTDIQIGPTRQKLLSLSVV